MSAQEGREHEVEEHVFVRLLRGGSNAIPEEGASMEPSQEVVRGCNTIHNLNHVPRQQSKPLASYDPTVRKFLDIWVYVGFLAVSLSVPELPSKHFLGKFQLNCKPL